MTRDAFTELEAAMEAVLSEGARFVDEVEPLLAASLRAGVERLRVRQADVTAGLDEESFDAAVSGAIDAGIAGTIERLRAPEIWLSPLTAPELTGRREAGWSYDVPEWAARMLGRGLDDRISLRDLDDPSNRIWIAVSAAASALDPVLREFGFRSGTPGIGGGRFGVGPRTLPALDPSGVLARRWRSYRTAFERMSALAQADG